MHTRNLKLICTVSLLTGSALASSLFFSKKALVFRSLESVTESGEPVYNRVRLLAGWDQDVWLMQQSHRGLAAVYEKWDRLAIVVDKSEHPYRSRFYQFTSGDLDFPPGSEIVPLKARCFACHANGPRAIRPSPSTPESQVSWLDRARLALWNLRVKSYGSVESRAGRELPGGVPFRSRMPILSQKLPIKSCEKCHSDNGIRKPLRVEHLGTADFLVREGFMPPFPFSTTESEKMLLRRMAAGTRPSENR